MYKIKNLLISLLMLTLMGCNNNQPTEVPSVVLPPNGDTPLEEISPDIELPQVDAPTVELPIVELTPSTPVITDPTPIPAPHPPTLPIFIGEGITTHTQQPYGGTIVKGGDAYLRYNQTATTMDKFELPDWEVTYRYEPMIEVLITNGTETLCARYSWKLKGFGYARPHCLWSDTRAAVPLEDMQNAYYGYSIVESRVWVNGAKNLDVSIE